MAETEPIDFSREVVTVGKFEEKLQLSSGLRSQWEQFTTEYTERSFKRKNQLEGFSLEPPNTIMVMVRANNQRQHPIVAAAILPHEPLGYRFKLRQSYCVLSGYCDHQLPIFDRVLEGMVFVLGAVAIARPVRFRLSVEFSSDVELPVAQVMQRHCFEPMLGRPDVWVRRFNEGSSVVSLYAG